METAIIIYWIIFPLNILGLGYCWRFHTRSFLAANDQTPSKFGRWGIINDYLMARNILKRKIKIKKPIAIKLHGYLLISFTILLFIGATFYYFISTINDILEIS